MVAEEPVFCSRSKHAVLHVSGNEEICFTEYKYIGVEYKFGSICFLLLHFIFINSMDEYQWRFLYKRAADRQYIGKLAVFCYE